MAKRGFFFDWTMRHGPLAGTLNAAGGALAAAALGHAVDVSAWWGLLGAGVGTAATWIAGEMRGWDWPKLPFRTAAMAGLSGWVTYAWATTPWSTDALGVLGVGALAGGIVSAGVAKYQRGKDEEQRRMLLATAGNRLAAEWEARIARVCHIKGAKVHASEKWETETGYTLDVDLPLGGSTWKEMKRYEAGLASDARLEEGCGVEVSAGANRGAVLIEVSTVNALREDYFFPADYSHTTINNPFPIGVHRDGTPTQANLRFICGATVGQTGSGKTNVVQVQNAQLVRCVDTVVWHIDLTGAGLALPWVRPWAEGRAPRPAIDWAAATAKDAHAMADAAIAIINTRKPSYQQLMREANDDKIPVSPAVPQIVIVADEFAELPEGLKTKIETISNTGRAAGVRTLVCGLRGTSDTIPAGLKKQAQLRIGMRVTDDEELSYLFGWGKPADPQDAPYEGCGFIAIGQDAARPFKAYRLQPSQIEEIAIAVSDRRPALDQISADAAGSSYVDRWKNISQLFHQPVDVSVAAGSPTIAPAPSDGWEEQPGSLDDALKRIDRAAEDLRQAGEATDPRVEQELAAFREQLDSRLLDDEGHQVPEPLAAIVGRFGLDTRAYISTADLAAGVGYLKLHGDDPTKAARALGEELNRLGLKAEQRRRPEYPSGKPVRGYFLADLLAAADQFRRGERTA